MTDTPKRPDHYAYESDYEQHRAWAAMTEDEKLESLWFGQLSFVRKSDGHTLQLKELNGNVQRTMKELAEHKTTVAQKMNEHEQYHKDELSGISFIKVWGARGTAAVLVLTAALGGVYYLTKIVEALTGSS